MASPCRHCHRPPDFRCLVSMGRPAVVVRHDVDDHRLRDRLPGRAWVGNPDGGYGGHRSWRHERYPVQKCRGPGGGDQARRHHFRQNCTLAEIGGEPVFLGNRRLMDTRIPARPQQRSSARCPWLPLWMSQHRRLPADRHMPSMFSKPFWTCKVPGAPLFTAEARFRRARCGVATTKERQAPAHAARWPAQGGAGKVIGLIAIADAPRSRAAATVAKLRERGVQVAMLTGDNAGTAHRIARDLGLDIVLADVLPGQKAGKVKELQAQGKKVGMVGDGVNDAPALTQADVGFAIGAGTDVAIESADVVLMKSDPYDVVGAVELSHATLRKMHQNLWWAVGYNVIAFPLAAGVFYPFLLSPEIAALAMSGSSALVAINALMLKRTKLAGITRRSSVQTSPLRAAEVTA